MSLYENGFFFLVLFIALIPAVILGVKEKSLKWYRRFLTILILWLTFRQTPIQLLWLILYVALSVTLVLYFEKYGRTSENKKLTCTISVVLAILPVFLVKMHTIVPQINIFAFLGISYICFRTIQVLLEMYDGLIEKIDVVEFVHFLLFFPALASGPIDRSRRFSEDENKIWSRAEYIDLMSMGYFKLALGMLYKIVLSEVAYEILQTHFADNYYKEYVIGYAYVYGLYLFFDFAGCSAMAVGTAYILGIKLPDNFKRPFLSVDIGDFWERWHISLAHWMRDFLFSRMLKDFIRKKRFKSRLTAAQVALIINLTVMGIWHGFTVTYLIYGIYHGVLMAVFEVYTKRCKFYKKHKNEKWYKFCSWFVTMNLIMFGFLIFSGHAAEVWDWYIAIIKWHMGM